MQTNDAEQSKALRRATRQFPIGRIAAATMAVGGLVASVFTVGSAGAATSHAKGIVISTAKNAKLGTILVSGNTLYTLKANKTPCIAQCLKVWPEVLLPKGVTKATAGTGVSASKLGTVKTANGALQVTYSGKALYWFSGDKAAGEVHGNVTDAWGAWSTFVTVKAAKSSSGTGSSSGGATTSTGGVAF